MDLESALNDLAKKGHKKGDTYKMDEKGEWKIAYYPLFECGKTNEVYEEPRALIERPSNWNGVKGTDFREVPLRYLERN